MVMNIRVLTPDRVICSTTADEVVLPGLTGQVGVLDGHAALITALDTGLLRIKLNDKWTPIILCGGLAEIDRNRVTVLVNDVEELTNVELSEATKELEKATLAVENAETSKDRLDASIELKKSWCQHLSGRILLQTTVKAESRLAFWSHAGNANSSPERLPLPIRLIFGVATSSCPTFQSGVSICQVSVSQSD